ncbi:hypothetical protein [Marivita hallyeonensis]|uniref:DUF1344 domain-containing protein n=1 Tax=Marivita hallyeonensis TaxID=996342 RepID=A0A1M5MW10_9RHOB|nr:hypothetical protein [Marivita hallyeonensis]SHG81516.1 hypothetical protein SAMN05443551_0677 [Marivita hallyeonensis]
MRAFLLSAALGLAATAAFADETEGLILAFDRHAHIIVLTDKTVWELPSDMAIPADLGTGDRVLFEYVTAGEDGLTKLSAMTRLAVALPSDADGGS